MSKIIAANFKMNLSYEDIIKYKEVLESSNVNVILAPSNIYLNILKSDKYDICSQDAYFEDKGAYTGEVSFNQLKSIGVKYSLIGHSERRHIFNENNDVISKKVNACIANGIIPILCVGETRTERNSNLQFEVVKEQIKTAFNDKKLDSIIIAYEPVWSIGTGLIPEKEDILKMHSYIKQVCQKYSNNIKVLYGGSVKETNIVDICSIDNVDGVLIGGASLDPNSLIRMTKSVNG